MIACVNVASLVLVRSESRRREIAVRGALGATPVRLMRQFVAEGLLLAFFGNLAGLIIAAALIRLLAGLVPKDMAANMPFLSDAGLNVHTRIFAATIALAAAILLAAIPTLRLSFQKVRDGLADGDRGVARSSLAPSWSKSRRGGIGRRHGVAGGRGSIGEKPLPEILHVPLGFDPNHLASVRVSDTGTA